MLQTAAGQLAVTTWRRKTRSPAFDGRRWTRFERIDAAVVGTMRRPRSVGPNSGRPRRLFLQDRWRQPSPVSSRGRMSECRLASRKPQIGFVVKPSRALCGPALLWTRSLQPFCHGSRTPNSSASPCIKAQPAELEISTGSTAPFANNSWMRTLPSPTGAETPAAKHSRAAAGAPATCSTVASSAIATAGADSVRMTRSKSDCPPVSEVVNGTEAASAPARAAAGRLIERVRRTLEFFVTWRSRPSLA